MAAEIFLEENAIVIAAARKMVSLGSSAAQKYVNGKESKLDDEKGQEILMLLTAYRQKTNLTDPQLESILYDLRELSEESVFPTIDPIIGQALQYITIEEGSGEVPDGTWQDQGGWSAAGGVFPSIGVKRGFTWDITGPGIFQGVSVEAGATIRAKADNPGQNLSLWSITY